MYNNNRKKSKLKKLKKIRKNLQNIYTELIIRIGKTFPKDYGRLLSFYKYKELKIHINSNGTVTGGIIRVIFSLIDFSFVRNVVADCYSFEGANCYDPASLFVLELIKIWNRYDYYSEFVKDLKDNDKGRQYRYLSGVDIENVPTEATFHNFKERLGEEKFSEIMGELVRIFNIVGIISGEIISTDGTLIEAFARYRGCNYGEKCCKCMDCKANIESEIEFLIEKAKDDLENNDQKYSLVNLKYQCPRKDILDKIKTLLKKKNKEIKQKDIATFNIIKFKVYKGKKKNLKNHKKYFETLIGTKIDKEYSIEMISNRIYRNETGEMKFSCPRASKDLDARTGYRRDKENSNKTESIFGYKAVIITSLEMELGVEIPIAVITGPGNLDESKAFVNLNKNLKNYVELDTDYHLLDSGYDKNYIYSCIREEGSIPIIDYNKRGENQEEKNLVSRGFDENGCPYAPCGRKCIPNGYDSKRNAVKNICDKQCMKTDESNNVDCIFRKNKHGYSKWMYIDKHPRIVIEVPRGSKKFKKLKAYRSSSERINGLAKEWHCMKNLRLLGKISYATRIAICCIAMMLDKVADCFVKFEIKRKSSSLFKKLYTDRKRKKNLKNCI
jgi:hypothetical protein